MPIPGPQLWHGKQTTTYVFAVLVSKNTLQQYLVEGHFDMWTGGTRD